MRIANLFLRKGKVYAIGKKGSGGVLLEAGLPAVAEPTVDGVCEALAQGLAASIIPLKLPDDLPDEVSQLPAAAGVKNETAFYRGATMCMVRELDDRIELLRGFRSGGGWHCKVEVKLPRDTPMRDVGAAALAMLNEGDVPMPIRTPPK